MTFYRTIVVVWIVDFEVDKKDQNKEKKVWQFRGKL